MVHSSLTHNSSTVDEHLMYITWTYTLYIALQKWAWHKKNILLNGCSIQTLVENIRKEWRGNSSITLHRLCDLGCNLPKFPPCSLDLHVIMGI